MLTFHQFEYKKLKNFLLIAKLLAYCKMFDDEMLLRKLSFSLLPLLARSFHHFYKRP